MPDFDSTLPAVRCSDEQRKRIEDIAERLAISTAKLIRAYVDYCSSSEPTPESALIVRFSRKVTEEDRIN